MKNAFPFIAAALAVGILIGGPLFPQQPPPEHAPMQETGSLALSGERLHSEIMVPAVDSNGEGVPVSIEVTIIPGGSGKTLTSIDNLFFWVDTQNSIRTAREVAQELTGLDLSTHDIIYQVNADAGIIEGPSAGAALTVATVSALENWDANPEVTITGTIQADGTIGRVGGILEKAAAAEQAGAETFLIPESGISFNQVFKYERQSTCAHTGGFEICETEYVRKDPPGTEGLEIIEVSHISQALEHFRAGGE